MADGNQDELISQFTNVTGATADRAKFYLESANGNLQVMKLCRHAKKCKSVKMLWLSLRQSIAAASAACKIPF